jgi:hypothetical protein
LPKIAAAFASGRLSIDKIVELTRFATPETEGGLISWAEGASPGAIRERGDLAQRREAEETVSAEVARSVTWWLQDEGRQFGLQAWLPASQGAAVAKAIERVARTLPVIPGEEGFVGTDARRADALVALCSARIAEDPDPDRATVVVHASWEALMGEENAQIEGGGVIPAQTARRLACNARIQMVIEDSSGQVIHLGRMRREPPEWMLRQLKYRDTECRFPGCGSRRFTHAHHIVWWDRGGRTDLDNLVLICSFHHRLVHEYGWRLTRETDGTVRWLLPDGTRYRAGPGPPGGETEGQPAMAAVAF